MKLNIVFLTDVVNRSIEGLSKQFSVSEGFVSNVLNNCEDAWYCTTFGVDLDAEVNNYRKLGMYDKAIECILKADSVMIDAIAILLIESVAIQKNVYYFQPDSKGLSKHLLSTEELAKLYY